MENQLSKCPKAESVNNLLLAVDHLDQAVIEIVRNQDRREKPDAAQENDFKAEMLGSPFLILALTFALAQALFLVALIK